MVRSLAHFAASLWLLMPGVGIAASDSLAATLFEANKHETALVVAREIISQQEATPNDKAEALYIIGQLNKKGYGVEKNISKAIHWLSQAAETGHLQAAGSLAKLFFEHRDISFSAYKKAIPLIAKAADAGDPSSKAYIGYQLVYPSYETKVPLAYPELATPSERIEKGFSMCSEAAVQESEIGHLCLYTFYYEGIGVTPNLEQALIHLERSQSTNAFAGSVTDK